jgi:hypothetical protein
MDEPRIMAGIENFGEYIIGEAGAVYFLKGLRDVSDKVVI